MLLGLSNLTSGQSLAPRDYFLMGAAKYKCNACAQAIEDFTMALSLQKDYPDALYGRSLAYLCIFEYKLALKDIDAAISLRPKEVLYYECKGRIKTQSGDLKGGLGEFENTIKRDSSVWQAWFGMGTTAHGLKDTAKAKLGYDNALRLNPNYALGWFQRGNLFRERGLLPAALADYSQGITLAGGYVQLFEARAQTYLLSGRYVEAKEDAEQAIRLDASRAISHFYLGDANRLLGEYSQADFNYDMATKLDKKMAQAPYFRAVCKDSLRDYPNARKYYSAAISKDKLYKDAFVARSRVWQMEEKPKKAVADLGSAIKLSKDDLDLYVRRAFLYLDLLDFQSAIQDFQAVIKKNPEHRVALYGMGIAKYGIGNVNGACADWSHAYDLGEPRAMEKIQQNCAQ